MHRNSPSDAGRQATLPPLMILLTAGLTGALVMVVEILGARIISPFFGVSLFVWTSLISVTLLSLAFGYAFGGWLADLLPAPDRLYLLIAAAGIWLVMLPLFKPFILEAMVPLGLRLGTFLAATLLFAPPLFLLGCVSPFILRLAALDLSRIGRTAGLLYAISTTGSFIGSAGTGFYLLGNLGVITTLRLSGALLILIALAYYLFSRRWRGLLLTAGLLPMAYLPPTDLEAHTSDGTSARILWARDSFYGAIKVVEYQGSSIRTREMTIDGLIQGGVDSKDGRSIYEYSYLLERLPIAMNPTGSSALIIGLGTGVVPRELARRGITVDVVEIDPLVHEAAIAQFGFPRDIPVIFADARNHLAASTKIYDFLLIDVFNGDTTPGYLLSRESLHHAKARLTSGGILAFNLMGSIDPDTGMLPSVISTLKEQFKTVRIQAANPKHDARWGNFVILATNREEGGSIMPDTSNIHPLASETVALLTRRRLFDDLPDAPALSDDFNPLDLRDIGLKEQVRREIIENTPLVILHALPGRI